MCTCLKPFLKMTMFLAVSRLSVETIPGPVHVCSKDGLALPCSSLPPSAGAGRLYSPPFRRIALTQHLSFTSSP